MSAVELIAAGTSKKGCKESVDRISNLPSDLTECILQCLPLKDAVRTSILSTHWRYQWTLLSQLILDEDFFSAILKFKCPCKETNQWSFCRISHDLFANSELVNNILRRHVGYIRKFSLHIPHWFPRHVDHKAISHWIKFASGKFVKEFSVYQHRRQLPSCMFASAGFNHLTDLTLINCRVSWVPTTFRGFPSLTRLVLHMLSEYAINVEIIVSKCPMLETLDLQFYDMGESGLNIHAPKLRDLVVTGQLSGICLEETKEIKSFSLRMAWSQERDNMIAFFTSLPHVEKLGFGGWFWETKWLKEVGQPKKLKFISELRQLKHLTLDTVPIGCQFAISFILSLFQTISKLEALEIDVWELSKPPPGNVKVEGSCCLDHLKSAKIISRDCTPRNSYSIMLQLIKVILSCSPILEVLTFQVNVPSKEKPNIDEEELLQYHRASANAKIILEKMQFDEEV